MNFKKLIDILRNQSGLDAKVLSEIEKFLNNADKKAKEDSKNAASDVEKNITELLTHVGNAQKAISNNLDALNVKYSDSAKELSKLREKHRDLTLQKEKLNDEQKKELDNLNAQIEHHETRLQQAKRGIQVERSNQVVLKASNRFLKDQIGLGYEMEDSFLGAMIAGDMAFSSIAASIKDAFTAEKLFASGLKAVQDSTLEYAKAQDTAMANLNRITAGTGEYDSMLSDIKKSNSAYGVTIEEASEAISGLHKNMTMFNTLSTEQQRSLADLGAKMSALGVSGEQFGQSTSTMMQALRMTTNEVESTQMQLVNLGTALGVSADVINSDFVSAAKTLSKYGGQDMMKVFKGLQGAAKATGIEFQSLISLTEQFDTFEGAATAAGKLNAILGGGVLNSTELLNAQDDERIRMLIQSIELSGKQWDSMNRFEKKAIMSAAGVSDMEQANKLFGQSLTAYDDMMAKSAATEESQKSLQERAAKAQSVQEKLTQAFQGFAVSMEPVINFISSLMTHILALNDSMGGYLFPILTAIIGVFYSYVSVLKVLTGIKIALNTIRQAESVWRGINLVLIGKEKAAELASIAVKQTSMAVDQANNIVKSETAAINNIVTPTNTALAGSELAVGAASGISAPLLFAFAAAALAVGAAVLMAVGSVALLVYSISLLITSLGDMLAKLSPAQMLSAAAGFAIFAAGIAFGLQIVMASIAALVAGIGSIMPVLAISIGAMILIFGSLAASIAVLAAALNLIPEKKMIAVGMATEGVSKMMEQSVKLTPEAVEHTRQIVKAAADYVNVQAEMLSPDADSFVQAIKGAFGVGGSKEKGGQDIVLVLNDREFGRAVNAAINKKHNLAIG